MFILPESSAESCQRSKSEELRFQNIFEIHSKYTFPTFYNCSYSSCLKDEMNAMRAKLRQRLQMSPVSPSSVEPPELDFSWHIHMIMEIIAHAARTNAKPQKCRLVSSCLKVSNMIIEQQIHTDTYRYVPVAQMELLIFNLQVGPFSPFSPEKTKQSIIEAGSKRLAQGSVLCCVQRTSIACHRIFFSCRAEKDVFYTFYRFYGF